MDHVPTKSRISGVFKGTNIILLLFIFIIFSLNTSFAHKSQLHSLSPTINHHSFQKKGQLITGRKGDAYQVFLENYQSDSLENKPTWIVVHGFGHSPHNLEDQELQQNLKLSGVQVLQVDWSSITKRSIFSVWSTAEFIPSVAEFVANSLIESRSLSGENINCIGHSFGSYVCWELAKRIKDFNLLLALEPASKKGTSLPWKNFYDVSKVDFSEYTKYSWGFVSSDKSSEKAALTADSSFLIEYNDYPDNRHNDIIGFISTLIRRNSKGEGGHVSRILDVIKMDENTTHPWIYTKSAHEGTLTILNENDEHHPYRWLPVSLHHKNGAIYE